ncbi:MAG TPA: c-type cytochrome [Solirubrobacteraceae bacterium]|nr:c-type cytochrome [Solirubrobacteraceae bacterium]
MKAGARQCQVRGAARAAAALLAAALLAGCAETKDITGASRPSGGPLALTPLQQQIEEGGRLFASEGCGACHLIGGSQVAGPNFENFAGHRVKLADGRRALVNEAFVRHVLADPDAPQLAGWDATAMRAALVAHHLSAAKVEDLAAFIEQIGAEG